MESRRVVSTGHARKIGTGPFSYRGTQLALHRGSGNQFLNQTTTDWASFTHHHKQWSLGLSGDQRSCPCGLLNRALALPLVLTAQPRLVLFHLGLDFAERFLAAGQHVFAVARGM